MADYVADQKIDGLTDVSGSITKATRVPVQDMSDTDVTGYASIESLVNKGLAEPGTIGSTTPGAVYHTAVTGKRTASATDYNPSALTTDYIIAITNTDAAREVTISTEDIDSGTTSQSRIMIIKDESGGAAAHNITVHLEGYASSGSIDKSSSYVINQNYQSITLYMDGANAWII